MCRGFIIYSRQKSIIFRTDERTDERTDGRKVWIKPLPTYIALRAISIFEHDPQKMSNLDVRHCFGRLHPPDGLPKIFEYDFYLCQTK